MIKIGLRPSPLSRAQFKEFEEEFSFFSSLPLQPIFIQTLGDRDKITSLKDKAPDNFFTYELDEALLQGKIDCALHSFKDLPPSLSDSFIVAAITKGKSPYDSLVFKKGKGEKDLLSSCRIGTSSLRRESDIKTFFPQAQCIDIRGTIEERLELLETASLDAVIIAEAALERLLLTHLKRKILPFETAKGQGRLGLVTLKEKKELLALFSVLHHPL